MTTPHIHIDYVGIYFYQCIVSSVTQMQQFYKCCSYKCQDASVTDKSHSRLLTPVLITSLYYYNNNRLYYNR